jgi:hypothetical protein
MIAESHSQMLPSAREMTRGPTPDVSGKRERMHFRPAGTWVTEGSGIFNNSVGRAPGDKE